MFLKRFLNSKRDKKAIITQLVLPLLMVLCGLLLITSIPTRTNDQPRVLKLSNLSIDDVFTKAFFADYRNVSSDVKQETLKVPNVALGSIFFIIFFYHIFLSFFYFIRLFSHSHYITLNKLNKSF